jgi:Fur family ferric uptake transcriptional regulator
LRESEMAGALRARGCRLTAQRLAVLKVVERDREHLTPAQVLERGRGIFPNLGLTTVYRTLDLLTRLGFVRRVHLGKGCRAYAWAKEKHGHSLICQSCHRVIDFPCFGLEEIIEEMGRRTGFTVQSHLLELVGICPSCQGKDLAKEQVTPG